MSIASYIIGIDLGTTNCTLSYSTVRVDDFEKPVLHLFSIPQMTKALETAGEPTLPAFIYFPLPEELEAQKNAVSDLPDTRSFAIGSYARDRGAELPGRVISSAKSWLSHSHVDRREKILPPESEEESNRMSPLEACRETLGYLRDSWNSAMPEAPFNDQIILVTVPASFDPGARQLVSEAAESAKFPEIILLEEPQAAFYAWLHAHSDTWRQELKPGDTILVADIGGGTTDFSLIRVKSENGNLHLEREAVGSHLLLGGDNIDLALAHLVKQKLEEENHTVDDLRLRSLVHQCRQAKELLFGDSPPSSVDLVLSGRGSRLIAGAIKAQLSAEEADRLITEGFFPSVDPEERSPPEQVSGLRQIGLPYVKDPRISCQLAKFLSMTGEADSEEADRFILPTAVLFNGGTLKAPAFRKRIMELLNRWAKKLKKPPVKELAGADYDFAVSKGAVYYGLARRGKAIRIRGGTGRSYYIGIEEAVPAVPGLSPPLRAVCIVPFGLEEGEECVLEKQEFALVLGEPATFRFFSRSTPLLSDGSVASVGTTVRNWKRELTELHPIETMLDKTPDDGKTVRVKLKARITELGVLELWCQATDGRKWKLEFDAR